MEKGIAIFTIITFLLFAVSTARIAFDQIVTDSAVLPNENLKSNIAADPLPQSESDTTITVDVTTIDPTQHLRFVRLHSINRHFFDHKTTRAPLRRHPCRKFMIPAIKMAYGNDVILSGKTYRFDPKAFGDQVPTKWLEFKHNYGHRHHHEHRHDKDEEFVPKHMFDREKMVSSSNHHKEKREHKGGFMRRIRKFLNHTFD